jgi:hypothetical protein
MSKVFDEMIEKFSMPTMVERYQAETDDWNRYKILYMQESSLGRMWQHMNNPDTVIGIISAYRSENDPAENHARTVMLKQKISGQNYGYIMLTGYWIETNAETGEKQKVTEESFAIISNKSKEKELDQFLQAQTKEFGQEGYLFKPSDTDHIYFADSSGNKSDIGTVSLDKMGDMYSTLKKGSHAGRPFVFEAAHSQRSPMVIGAALSELRKANLPTPFATKDTPPTCSGCGKKAYPAVRTMKKGGAEYMCQKCSDERPMFKEKSSGRRT